MRQILSVVCNVRKGLKRPTILFDGTTIHVPTHRTKARRDEWREAWIRDG